MRCRALSGELGTASTFLGAAVEQGLEAARLVQRLRMQGRGVPRSVGLGRDIAVTRSTGKAPMDHGQTVEDASAPSPRPRAVHAFEAVYVDGYGDLVRLATVLTSSRARAEELVQDAYVTAFMKWSKIATYEEPRLWLRRVVINRAFSHRRRIQAELRGLVRLGGTAARESSSDPGHEALASADPVWQEVARLPRRQAQVLVLVAL